MAPKETEKSTESRKEMPAGPQRLVNDAAALQAFGLNTMTGMGVAWAEALSDMGSEVLSFVADRIKEDVKTQHKMLHCKDLGELQHIQAEFVQNAIEQYQAETGKLVEMSRHMMRRADKDGDVN